MNCESLLRPTKNDNHADAMDPADLDRWFAQYHEIRRDCMPPKLMSDIYRKFKSYTSQLYRRGLQILWSHVIVDFMRLASFCMMIGDQGGKDTKLFENYLSDAIRLLNSKQSLFRPNNTLKTCVSEQKYIRTLKKNHIHC